MSSTMNGSTSFLDLPIDILLMIFPYLSAHDFLSLCSTCHAIQDNPELIFCSSYWNSIVKSTFRVPNQPVVESDGRRWMKLYKRMLTQTKVYTWGNNDHGSLGIPVDHGIAWPTEIAEPSKLGIVADLQCGGWSTVVLSSKGALYVIGVTNGLRHGPQDYLSPVALVYPPGYVDPDERYEPSTAIQQFSVGRTHVLGLSDSGRLWSWSDQSLPGLHIKFWNIDLIEGGATEYSERRRGCVRSAKAGWDRSSAYVNGTGIVVWRPVNHRDIAEEEGNDGVLIMDNGIIPKTGFLRSPNVTDIEVSDGLQQYGEVKNWINLEKLVVFVTDLGRVFMHPIDLATQSDPLPIMLPVAGSSEYTQDIDAIDVQGSFRSFAIFLRDGTVLTGDELNLSLLSVHHEARYANHETPALNKIPCLQRNGVISIAFGDYHYHALHSNGTITSYGTELRFCGALGLGGLDEHILRGVRVVGPRFESNGGLIEKCYTTGRRVHFEKEKLLWLRHARKGGKYIEEAAGRLDMMFRSLNIRAEVSEWFEQRLRDWEYGDADVDGTRGPANQPLPRDDDNDNDDDDDDDDDDDASSDPVTYAATMSKPIKSTDSDGLATYFALSVAAAGWHSGALVLVNSERAEEVRNYYLVRPEHPVQPPGRIETFLRFTNRTIRWSLGLPTHEEAHEYRRDFDPTSTPPPRPANTEEWVWEDMAFPRLRLSDGREMPGRVEFNEWRYPLPEWKETEKVVLGYLSQ